MREYVIIQQLVRKRDFNIQYDKIKGHIRDGLKEAEWYLGIKVKLLKDYFEIETIVAKTYIGVWYVGLREFRKCTFKRIRRTLNNGDIIAKRYFCTQVIVVFALLMSINTVQTEGEKVLEADEQFISRHEADEQVFNETGSIRAGISEEECNYIDNTERLGWLGSLQSTRVEIASIEKKELERRMNAELDREKLITEMCESYVGKIDYNFGMKPTYDGWTLDKGLDCSGFVEFIYMQCGIKTKECLESTLTTYLECKEITHDELKVGYLGMVTTGGSYYYNSLGQVNYTGDFDGDGVRDEDTKVHANHVGIYLGQNEEGSDIWCHCNAKNGTVVIGEFSSFKYYYAVTIEEE